MKLRRDYKNLATIAVRGSLVNIARAAEDLVQPRFPNPPQPITVEKRTITFDPPELGAPESKITWGDCGEISPRMGRYPLVKFEVRVRYSRTTEWASEEDSASLQSAAEGLLAATEYEPRQVLALLTWLREIELYLRGLADERDARSARILADQSEEVLRIAISVMRSANLTEVQQRALENFEKEIFKGSLADDISQL